MVVGSLVQVAVAGPTGMLFGLAYGTAIRIGYEQIYPALFPETDENKVQNVNEVMSRLEKVFDAVGGKEAHLFGVNQGLKNALQQMNNDPEMIELAKKNFELYSPVITEKKFGDSKQDTTDLEQSLPSLSNVDTTGGRADRLRGAIEAQHEIENSKDKESALVAMKIYTDNVKGLIKLRGRDISTNEVKALIQEGAVDIVGFRVQYGFLTFEFQQEIRTLYNNRLEKIQDIHQIRIQKTEDQRFLDGLSPLAQHWFNKLRPLEVKIAEFDKEIKRLNDIRKNSQNLRSSVQRNRLYKVARDLAIQKTQKAAFIKNNNMDGTISAIKRKGWWSDYLRWKQLLS